MMRVFKKAPASEEQESKKTKGHGLVAPNSADTIKAMDKAIKEAQAQKKKGRWVESCCGRVWIDG